MNLIISGQSGSGKTILCEKYVANQIGCGRTAAGILTPRVMDENGALKGYELIDIRTGSSRLFATKQGASFMDNQPTIIPESLAFAEAVLSEALLSDVELIVIDEYGSLEMDDEGFASAANAAIRSVHDAIVVVPQEHLAHFLDKFSDQRFGLLLTSEVCSSA